MIHRETKRPLPVVETESGGGKKISGQAINIPTHSLAQNGAGRNAPLISTRNYRDLPLGVF